MVLVLLELELLELFQYLDSTWAAKTAEEKAAVKVALMAAVTVALMAAVTVALMVEKKVACKGYADVQIKAYSSKVTFTKETTCANMPQTIPHTFTRTSRHRHYPHK